MVKLSITVGGDIAFDGDLHRKLKGHDPFEFIKTEIENSDISIANCECVLSNRGTPTQTWVNIKSNSSSAEHLKIFTLLCLANNHIMDYGAEGLTDTINVLTKIGVRVLGAGSTYQQAINPLVIKRNSIKIGVINFTASTITSIYRSKLVNKAGPARYDEEYVLRQIRKLKRDVDIVVASIHWGVEYVYFPQLQQQILARKLVDSGCGLVIGSHPHVVQGIERYKHGLILYSLGNLFFDTTISNVRKSMLVRVQVSRDGVLGYDVIALKLNNNHQPYRVTGPAETEFLKFIDCLSAPMLPEISEKFWFEQASEICLKSYKASYKTLMKKYGTKPMIPFFLGLGSPYLIKHYAGFIRSKLRSLVR